MYGVFYKNDFARPYLTFYAIFCANIPQVLWSTYPTSTLAFWWELNVPILSFGLICNRCISHPYILTNIYFIKMKYLFTCKTRFDLILVYCFSTHNLELRKDFRSILHNWWEERLNTTSAWFLSHTPVRTWDIAFRRQGYLSNFTILNTLFRWLLTSGLEFV